MERIGFLTYMNRSGSTFLAKLLSECADISAGIEAHIPDGILFSCVVINEPWDVRKALKILYSDDKFYTWNIEKEKLEREISNLGFAIGYNELLWAKTKMYFKK